MALESELRRLEADARILQVRWETMEATLNTSFERSGAKFAALEASPSALSMLGNKLETLVLPNDLSRSLQTLDASFSELQVRVAEVVERADALSERAETIAGEFDEQVNKLTASIENAREGFETAFDEVAERLTDGADNMFERCQDSFQACGEKLSAHLEDSWRDQFEDIFEAARAELASDVEGLSEVVATISNEVVESLQESVQEVKSRVVSMGDALVDDIMAAIRQLLEDRLRQIVEGMVSNTTIGAQVTAFLQPYLPQLMTAKIVAGSVQRLLNAARLS